MANGALAAYQQSYNQAQAANLKRYDQAMAIYDEIIKRYQPGGSFGQAALQQLETQKTRDVGAETHQMMSSGLAGTTGMGAIGRRWEESVGQPARLRLEDLQMQRLSEAQLGKASFIERREDVGPDLGMMASLMGQAGYQSQPAATGGRTFGASSFQGSGLLYQPGSGALGGQRTGGTGQRITRASAGLTPKGPGVQQTTAQTTAQRPAWNPRYTPAAQIALNQASSVTPQQVSAATSPSSGFSPYVNYSAKYYQKTGQQLSQQAAYKALQGA
jgi:hypothetical protein